METACLTLLSQTYGAPCNVTCGIIEVTLLTYVVPHSSLLIMNALKVDSAIVGSISTYVYLISGASYIVNVIVFGFARIIRRNEK